MLRVAVSGYYGFNNTGDEAILLALVSTLRTLAPGVEITVFSHRPRETRQIYGVKAVNRWNPFGICWALLRSDLLLSGGGGLLQDVTGVRSICYYLGVVLLARLLGRPVIYYAQGLGPVRTRFGRWLTRVVSNRVELITVRDQASRDDFLEMGVTRPPVIVTADPALALSPTQVDLELGERLLVQLRAASEQEPERGSPAAPPGTGQPEAGEPRRLGIVLRDWQDCYQYKRAVAAAADRLIREGWEVVLIPFHFPGDLQASREVSWLMQEPALLVRSKLSVDTLFSLLGRLDLVLSMRLHALIMASVMRTPCVGISYDPKVERFLELTGQPVAGTVADLDAERLYEVLNGAWERRASITAHLDQVLVNLRQQAWETASMALSVFYSRFPHRRWEAGRAARRGSGEASKKHSLPGA
ncbi:MAG: polysaccharide pyruvyl transferase CsaB [Bacillota bacterium]|nr:polysaccharide pyruvyl transferase CsaB [Bacillota bacterium]